MEHASRSVSGAVARSKGFPLERDKGVVVAVCKLLTITSRDIVTTVLIIALIDTCNKKAGQDGRWDDMHQEQGRVTSVSNRSIASVRPSSTICFLDVDRCY